MNRTLLVVLSLACTIGLFLGGLFVASQASSTKAPSSPAAKPSAKPPGNWRAVPVSELCVTVGSLRANETTTRLVSSQAKMRALAPGTDHSTSSVRLDFVYRGPTKKKAPLFSSGPRTQIGLKLRAANTCNVTYVMWRIAPKPGIVVSVKRNPQQSTHKECKTRGYRNIRPTFRGSIPSIQVGVQQQLSVLMEQNLLRVFVNNKKVWQGNLGSPTSLVQGPVGIRTDNGKFELTLQVANTNPNISTPLAGRQRGLQARRCSKRERNILSPSERSRKSQP